MKLQISYTREGDGFQCNTICDVGYIYSFYFCHGPPPNVGEQFKDLELSPTAQCVVWLASCLPNRWTQIYMDSLFNSKKLHKALNMTEALVHGVAHTNGQGIPSLIIQKEEKNVLRAEQLCSMTMAVMLLNYDACPNLLAASVYNTKPVHTLSSMEDCVKWIVKKREVRSDVIQKKAVMKYLQLNVIKEYNNHMNSTDIADQLRGNYRPDRWMRQRKWWWVFFI